MGVSFRFDGSISPSTNGHNNINPKQQPKIPPRTQAIMQQIYNNKATLFYEG